MSVKAIVVSASSDIGRALCTEWRSRGWQLFGTYRTPTALEGVELVHADLSDPESTEKAAEELIKRCPSWDVLVLAPGNLEPIGNFADVDFTAWEGGIQVNFLRPLRLLHRLLPFRNQSSALGQPAVLFFAGGGSNNAPLHYSCYNLSKIALTKMCEFLDAEMPDTRFVILGPGYVKTKIHQATLASDKVGEHKEKLAKRLANNACTPMADVVASCTWLLTTPCRAVGGRNFSTAFDAWGSSDLEQALTEDINMYKLRRSGNQWGQLCNR